MSSTLVLHFRVPKGDEGNLKSRLKTFQSSLFGWLRENGWGEVDWSELDKLEPAFSVFGIKASKLKRVEDWIENEVETHGLLVSIEAMHT